MSNVYGRDGIARTPEQLAKTYNRLESYEATRSSDGKPGRPPGDPFGESEPEKKWKTPFEQGTQYAIDLFKFAQILQMQDAIPPEQVVFGVELMALNILNVKDMPISPAQVEAARKAAFEYYSKNSK